MIDDFCANHPKLCGRVKSRKAAFRALEKDYVESVEDKARGLAQQGQYKQAIQMIDGFIQKHPKWEKRMKPMKIAYAAMAK
ncbi:MAG: hypothetical protein ACODAJ_12840 [Planctomycetota bacterium]